MPWVIMVVILFVIGSVAQATRRARRRKNDQAAQEAIAEAEKLVNVTEAPATAEVDLASPLTEELQIETPTKWESFQAPVLRGVRFPGGGVAVMAIAEKVEGGKGKRFRLTRDATITYGSKGFDRCCVGLARLAGIDGPVHLPYPIDYDTSGKAMRPRAKVSEEVVISYDDAKSAHSTRRISVIGFEPVGLGRRTDEVYLHAWCWAQSSYRTFALSRIASLTEVGTQRRPDPIGWAWEKGGLKFSPTDELRAKARRHR